MLFSINGLHMGRVAESDFIPPSENWGGPTFLAAGGQLGKFPLEILATLLVFQDSLCNCAVNKDLSSVGSQHLMKASFIFPV